MVIKILGVISICTAFLLGGMWVEYHSTKLQKEDISKIMSAELENREDIRIKVETLDKRVTQIREWINKKQEENRGKAYEFFLPINFDEMAGTPSLYDQPLNFPMEMYAKIGFRGGSSQEWGVCKIEDNKRYIDPPIWSDPYALDRHLKRSDRAERAYNRIIDVLTEQGCHLWLNLYSVSHDGTDVVLHGSLHVSYEISGEKRWLRDLLYKEGLTSEEFNREQRLLEFFDKD